MAEAQGSSGAAAAALTAQIEGLTTQLAERDVATQQLTEELGAMTSKSAGLEAQMSNFDELRQKVTLLDEAVATAKTATAKQVEYEEKYIVEAKKRKKFMGELEDIRGNVRVYARIRPLSSTERAKTEYFDAEHPDGMCLRFPPPELGEVLEAENPQNPGTFKPFKFNQVFGPGSTQERVFQEVAPLVERAMDGFNVCVFAYGQSGR